jgi:hypothetical protein
MDTQLSRFKRSMTARPCRSSFAPFDGTISSERIAPTACSRLATARFINYTLPTKLVLTGVYRAGPQAADAKALAASCFDMGAK